MTAEDSSCVNSMKDGACTIVTHTCNVQSFLVTLVALLRALLVFGRN